MTERPTLGQCILAALIAGAAAALLANLTLLVLSRHLNQSSEALNAYSVTRAAAVASMLGGVVYAALLRVTRHALLWFISVGVAVTVLDSILVAQHPPEPGIARLANPLHGVVALTALILIPALAPVIPRAQRSATEPRQKPPAVPKQA